MNFKKFAVKQYDSTDCAACCLVSVCLYYKKDISITQIRDVLGTNKFGTTLKGLNDAVKKLNFETKAIRIDREGFNSTFTLPSIAHLVNKNGLNHFVVIYKKDRKNIIIMDPNFGIKVQNIDEFFKWFDGIIFLLIPNKDFKIEKIKKQSTFFEFFKIISREKSLFFYSILTSIILTILGISSSFFNKFLIDEILLYNLKNELFIFTLAFILIGITQVILSAIRQHILLYISQKISISVLLGYFKHIYKLPIKFFMTRKIGDIITRFKDASILQNILTSVTLSLFIDIFLTISSAIVLYIINHKLFFIILIITVLISLLIYLFKNPYRSIKMKQMEAESRLNSYIIENLKGIETIKINAAEEKCLSNLEKEYIRNVKIAFNGGVISNIQTSISSGITTLGDLILMYAGASMVISNNITLGSLITFISLTEFFMAPITRIIDLQINIQEASVSLKRLSEIYEVNVEQDLSNNVVPSNIDGNIIFKNVSFGYGGSSLICNKLNIEIPRGKKVAIVGTSGSGKTTIAKLLLRYYNPKEGEILIGDYDIKEYDIYDLRRSIAYVPQNIELFSGTIKDNITLGVENYTYNDIRNSCDLSECNFINSFPEKYNTFLEEMGQGLSGGEKQKIALARAIIKDANFLILDEATSNLDFMSEAKIYSNIFDKLKDKTVLIIAHRLFNIRNCDLIYVIDNGKIIEKGDHNELLNNKGHYYNLYKNQTYTENSNFDLNEKDIDKGETNIKNNNYENGDEIEYR